MIEFFINPEIPTTRKHRTINDVEHIEYRGSILSTLEFYAYISLGAKVIKGAFYYYSPISARLSSWIILFKVSKQNVVTVSCLHICATCLIQCMVS
jgi:hypothetical protein